MREQIRRYPGTRYQVPGTGQRSSSAVCYSHQGTVPGTGYRGTGYWCLVPWSKESYSHVESHASRSEESRATVHDTVALIILILKDGLDSSYKPGGLCAVVLRHDWCNCPWPRGILASGD